MNDAVSAPSPLRAPAPLLGDMPPEVFREAGDCLVRWIGEYLAGNTHYPVLSNAVLAAFVLLFPLRRPLTGNRCRGFSKISSEFSYRP